MGLPLFITPVEPENTASSVEKTAALPRSAIRRHRTRSTPRTSASLGRISHGSGARRFIESSIDHERNREPVESRQTNSRDPARPPTSFSRSRPMRRMFELPRMRLGDDLSLEQPYGPESEVDGPLMPPVPESRDYSGMEDISREPRRLTQMQDLRRLARRHPAPTPPYYDGDHPHRRPESLYDSPGWMEWMSTAHSSAAHEEYIRSMRPPGGSDVNYAARRRVLSLSEGPAPPANQRPALEPERASELSQRVRELNRASQSLERSRRLLRRARYDGLGDRDRSLSPEGGAAWDTLLTSITPDPQPPSAGSSFASAAAAASSTESGQTSASTSITSPEGSEDSHMIDMVTTVDCISSSETESEDEEEERANESIGARTYREARFRSYADVAMPHGNRRNSERISLASDADGLGGWHRIISRLTERDDIPDAWWASAGLTRTLRREPTS